MLRYETAPGHQLQIDFGSTAVPIGDETQRVHVFVGTLGYSRRGYVTAFLHERQSARLQGLEGAFRHFDGVTHEVLVDNARALVDEHNVQTREVKFNDRFLAFSRYWGFTPRACAPYRAHQGQGRTWRRLRQAQRHRWPPLRQHRGAAGAPDALDARGSATPGSQVDQRDYGTSSEYVREPIRRDQDRLQPRLKPGMKVRPVIPREQARRDVEDALAYCLGEDAESAALGFVDTLERRAAVDKRTRRRQARRFTSTGDER